jgi:hypothetical protein
MNFKCNECVSEVINITLTDSRVVRFKSLCYLPEVLSGNWLEEETWEDKSVNTITAECDGCGHIWKAGDLDGLKNMMLQQGVIYE